MKAILSYEAKPKLTLVPENKTEEFALFMFWDEYMVKDIEKKETKASYEVSSFKKEKQ